MTACARAISTTHLKFPFPHTEVFERAAQSGIPTVYRAFVGAFGQLQCVDARARSAFRKSTPDMQLHIVDTKLASVAEGALVYEAPAPARCGPYG